MNKYDWSNVPKEVKWIATDSNVLSGNAFGYINKPQNIMSSWVSDTNEPIFHLGIKPFQGHWQDSLEERPK